MLDKVPNNRPSDIHMDKKKNILLWKNKIWESKVSNAGDLAIIRNTFLKLKAQVPEAQLHIVSDDPEHVSRQYGVVAHPLSILRHPLQLAKLLRQMDLVILGGGTVLQDDYFVGIIPINLSVPLLAKALGARLACNAIGVGSDEELSAIGKALCRWALPHFSSVTVRDEESRDMVQRLAPLVNVDVTNDIAVDLPPASLESIRDSLEADGVAFGGRPVVVIAARKIFHHESTWLYVLPSSVRTRLGLNRPEEKERLDEFKTTLARFSDHLVREYGVTVVLLPFYSSGGAVDSQNRATPKRHFSSGDLTFARDVYSRAEEKEHVRVLERSYQPEEMLAIIGRADAMVGVPYHSVVFASSQNVPVLGIHYVSKVARYMKILGLERFVVPATLERGLPLSLLTDKFAALWRDRSALRAQLAARNQELIHLANRNVAVIKTLLREES